MPPPTAASPLDALCVEELSRAQFDSLRSEWDALLARSGQEEPFLRHAFLKAWLDNFAPEAPLRLLAARERGRLVAVLPLLEGPARVFGVPVRRLRPPANVHSCRFDLIAESDRPEAIAALWSHLKVLAQFDALVIPDVPEGGRARALLACARRDGWRAGEWESMRTPYIPLAGGFEAVARGTDAKLKQNLRRRARKLAARGRVEVERCAGGPELEARLEEAFALEQSGWKGRGGTAIAMDPAARGFYAEWARQAALEGRLSLSFLRLSGEAVAFQLGIEEGGVYYLPKTAYREEHADCSPGQLLLEAVLRDACARGLSRFDFLGPPMPWKREWTAHYRAHHWLWAFAPTVRGTVAHALKFRAGPWAKEALGWKR